VIAVLTIASIGRTPIKPEVQRRVY